MIVITIVAIDCSSRVGGQWWKQLEKHPPFVVTWLCEAIRCKMSVVRFYNCIYLHFYG